MDFPSTWAINSISRGKKTPASSVENWPAQNHQGKKSHSYFTNLMFSWHIPFFWCLFSDKSFSSRGSWRCFLLCQDFKRLLLQSTVLTYGAMLGGELKKFPLHREYWIQGLQLVDGMTWQMIPPSTDAWQIHNPLARVGLAYVMFFAFWFGFCYVSSFWDCEAGSRKSFQQISCDLR